MDELLSPLLSLLLDENRYPYSYRRSDCLIDAPHPHLALCARQNERSLPAARDRRRVTDVCGARPRMRLLRWSFSGLRPKTPNANEKPPHNTGTLVSTGMLFLLSCLFKD